MRASKAPTIVRAVLRHAVLIVGTLLACAPWGLPQSVTLLPMLLLAAYVAIITLRPTPKLAYAALFLAGIVIDAVSFSPLGFSSVLLLVSRAAADVVAERAAGAGWFAQLLTVVAVLALVTAIAWTITSAYIGVPMAPVSFSYPLLIACALTPLVAMTVEAIDGTARPRSKSGDAGASEGTRAPSYGAQFDGPRITTGGSVHGRSPYPKELQ